MIHPTYLARCKDCDTPVAGLMTWGQPTPPLGWCNHCGRFTGWDWNLLLDGMKPCDFGLRSVSWNIRKKLWNKAWIQGEANASDVGQAGVGLSVPILAPGESGGSDERAETGTA